jgi:hypothetical protein
MKAIDKYVTKRVIHMTQVSTLTGNTLTKLFVVKITVERCDKFWVAVRQIFDRVKSVALWSAKKKEP